MTKDKFRELYDADIARYGGNAESYIKIFHFLHRKASSATITPIRLFYKTLFRLWANRRGLEITANEHIGGGFILVMPIISLLMGGLN